MDRITAAKVFVSIVDQGSMVSAANALDMSRSMVTRYLAEMESWADSRLLHRSTRKLSLTPAGELVLNQCRQLLELSEGVAGVGLLDVKAPSGLVRISCAQFLAHDVLGAFVHDYLERYPATQIDLHISNYAVNMVEERIDLAIRITNDLDPNLIARPLGRCHSLICASPDYVERYGALASPDELRRHNCLAYSYIGSQWNFSNQEEQEPIVVPVKGNFSASESRVLLNRALAGGGISMQPLFAAKPLIEAGHLVQLLPEYQVESLGIYGIYRSRKHMSPALRALLDELVEYFSTIDI